MVPIFACAASNLTVVGGDVNSGQYRGVGGMMRLARRMRREYSPEVFVDLHDVLRTRLIGLFLRLHGIRVERIDKQRGKRRALTRRHNKVMLPLSGMRQRYADVFARAGLPLEERFDGGLYGGRHKAPVEAFAAITGSAAPGVRRIGIAPFAAHSGKIYPPELMEQVVDALAEEPDVEIFLLGGGGNEA